MFVSSRKFIKVRIFDDEEYEKNEVFSIELGEPYLTRRGSGKDLHHQIQAHIISTFRRVSEFIIAVMIMFYIFQLYCQKGT